MRDAVNNSEPFKPVPTHPEHSRNGSDDSLHKFLPIERQGGVAGQGQGQGQGQSQGQGQGQGQGQVMIIIILL